MFSISNVASLFAHAKAVNFYPYVGQGYFSAPHKILVLGESHYGPDSNNSYREWTIEVVEDFYMGCKSRGESIPDWARCHDNTARVIAPVADANSYLAYKDVAFYNFFQRSVGEGNHRAKDKVSPELVALSRQALGEVLDVLKPDLVIGWGYSKLEWTWLPEDRKQIWELPKRAHLFTLDGYRQCPIWCMKHPSSCFPISDHREIFEKIKEYLGW